MRKLTSTLCLSIVVVAVLAVSPADAKSKKKKDAAPPPKPPTIASVSADSITVSDEKGSHTFAISQFTEVMVKGQRARATDLQAGMTVSVTQGTDATKASKINAGDPPATAR